MNILVKIKNLIARSVFSKLIPAYHLSLAFLAALFYRFPSRKLIVIGVTGTTGKSSSIYFLQKLLNENAWSSGFSSTTQFNDGSIEWLNDKKMTMPGRFFLQKHLAKMLKNGSKVAIIESTSQGIEQFRHKFINYDLLVFTKLYPEHIESHGSFENYKEAKAKLFRHLKNGETKFLAADGSVVLKPSGLKKTELWRFKKTLVINADDEHAKYFLSFPAERRILFTQNPNLQPSDFNEDEDLGEIEINYYQKLFSDQNGSKFSFNQKNYELSVLGDYQVFNASAALSVAKVFKIDDDALAESLFKLKNLAGKMEKIDLGQNFKVLVDYAFEPRALESLYNNLNLIDYNRLIHILGSTGGGRDKSRRAILGGMAAKKADIVIVTDEDPYDEDPELIIEEVISGASKNGAVLNENLFKVLDRREAIRLAISLARANDLVLITGKGAEQHICGPENSKIAWDDRKVFKEEIGNFLKILN